MKKNTIHKRQVYKECWDLDNSFLKWLKQHLTVYLNSCKNFIDFSYMKFNYKEKEYTQDQLIKMILELCDKALGMDTFDDDYVPTLREIVEIWGVVIPAMWW